MSKVKNKVKEVPRYQTIEIPAMFLIMGGIVLAIIGITKIVASSGANYTTALNLALWIIFTAVAFILIGTCAWFVTCSNNPKRAVTMIILTVAEMGFFVFTFFREEFSIIIPIIFLPMLAIMFAGELMLLIKGSKILASLPEPPVSNYKGKKKKAKKH